MSHLESLADLLPSPLTSDKDSVIRTLLDVIARELESADEDLDLLRRCHWIRTAPRLAEAEKLARLMGIASFPWEGLEMFRERALALVTARLEGAVVPRAIRRFVFEYLRSCQDVLGCTFVPGLAGIPAGGDPQAFSEPSQGGLRRPLVLKENPERRRSSAALEARSGVVPALFRWREENAGLDEAVPAFLVDSVSEGRTCVPVLVNETTGELIGYRGTVPFGRTLLLRASLGAGLKAEAFLDGTDVSDRLFSARGVVLGEPFTANILDPAPRMPRMARGPNEWIYLDVGLYDVSHFNHVFFALAGKDLRQGAFDETFFDRALFPTGPAAVLQMDWVEVEPASFEVRVPRCIVVEPSDRVATSGARPCDQVAQGLTDSIHLLHAAGVRAAVKFVAFEETQAQAVSVRMPWKVLAPETGPTGAVAMSQGGRFGESPLGGAQYE